MGFLERDYNVENGWREEKNTWRINNPEFDFQFRIQIVTPLVSTLILTSLLDPNFGVRHITNLSELVSEPQQGRGCRSCN